MSLELKKRILMSKREKKRRNETRKSCVVITISSFVNAMANKVSLPLKNTDKNFCNIDNLEQSKPARSGSSWSHYMQKSVHCTHIKKKALLLYILLEYDPLALSEHIL